MITIAHCFMTKDETCVDIYNDLRKYELGIYYEIVMTAFIRLDRYLESTVCVWNYFLEC